jgi:uncharacterized protein DUF6982
MALSNKVVVHFSDGRVLKGSTQNFLPSRETFHVLPADGTAVLEIRTQQLKGLFFVKDLAGDALRRDLRGFLSGPGEATHGKKLAVRFADGELLCGYSLAFLPGRSGFFVFPCDSAGNNLRVYVVSGATVEVAAGPAADALAQRVLARASDDRRAGPRRAAGGQ